MTEKQPKPSDEELRRLQQEYDSARTPADKRAIEIRNLGYPITKPENS